MRRKKGLTAPEFIAKNPLGPCGLASDRDRGVKWAVLERAYGLRPAHGMTAYRVYKYAEKHWEAKAKPVARRPAGAKKPEGGIDDGEAEAKARRERERDEEEARLEEEAADAIECPRCGEPMRGGARCDSCGEQMCADCLEEHREDCG